MISASAPGFEGWARLLLPARQRGCGLHKLTPAELKALAREVDDLVEKAKVWGRSHPIGPDGKERSMATIEPRGGIGLGPHDTTHAEALIDGLIIFTGGDPRDPHFRAVWHLMRDELLYHVRPRLRAAFRDGLEDVKKWRTYWRRGKVWPGVAPEAKASEGVASLDALRLHIEGLDAYVFWCRVLLGMGRGDAEAQEFFAMVEKLKAQVKTDYAQRIGEAEKEIDAEEAEG